MTMLEINFTTYIPTTVLGLLGLISGYLFFYFKNKTDSKLQIIQSADQKDRIAAIEMYLNELGTPVDTSNLNSVEKLDLLKEMLRSRTRKYLIYSVTAIILAILATFLLHSNATKDVPTTKADDTAQVLKIGNDKFPNVDFTKYVSAPIEVSESESEPVTISKGDFVCDISIFNSPADTSEGKDGYSPWKYALYKNGDIIKIEPDMSYLSLLKQKSLIEPREEERSPLGFIFPTLDFKFVNNSTKSIFLTRAEFDVSQSSTNKYPLLLLAGQGNSMSLPLVNIGWDSVYNAKMYFNIVSSEKDIDLSKLPFEKELGTFAYSSDSTDLYDTYSKFGVNPLVLLNPYTESTSGINGSSYTVVDEKTGKEYTISEEQMNKRMKDALGIFKDGSSQVYGYIAFSGKDVNNILVRDTFHFICPVSLGAPGEGAVQPPSYSYSVMLDLDKKKYKKTFSLSHIIKPNDADRFTLRLAAPKSSYHLFNINLYYNDNQMLTIPSVFLNYYMSREDSSYLNR